MYELLSPSLQPYKKGSYPWSQRRGSERLNDLPRVTQPGSGRARTRTQAGRLRVHTVTSLHWDPGREPSGQDGRARCGRREDTSCLAVSCWAFTWSATTCRMRMRAPNMPAERRSPCFLPVWSAQCGQGVDWGDDARQTGEGRDLQRGISRGKAQRPGRVGGGGACALGGKD